MINKQSLWKTHWGGADFYSRVASGIHDDPNVTDLYRKVGTLDFIFNAGNAELDTYMTINEPVTGVVQEHPSYTNVVNGLGLLASRYTKFIVDKALSTPSIRELTEGEITGHLNFCSDEPEHQLESFYPCK